jgi:hypothetical protein
LAPTWMFSPPSLETIFFAIAMAFSIGIA